jgi:hypothetical protein
VALGNGNIAALALVRAFRAQAISCLNKDRKDGVMDERESDHLNGKHVVVEYVYGNGKGTRFLLESLDVESEVRELWREIAFTNGPPLGEIRLRWDPKMADELREQLGSGERHDG